MTEERLNKAQRLKDLIYDLESFLQSFNRMEIVLKFYDDYYDEETRENVDSELQDTLRQYYEKKLKRLKKEFEEL